jgi:hypothetical protein
MAVEENTNGLKFRDSPPVSYSEKETKNIYSPQDFVIPLEEALHFQEDSIIHAIILPNYMEDIETLRETLEVLASHRKAKLQYEVGDITQLSLPCSSRIMRNCRGVTKSAIIEVMMSISSTN